MDITEIRRRRLAEAEALAGGIVKLAEIAGLSEKYLRQIKTGFQGRKDRNPRRLGDDAARRIEAALDKGRGWMDTSPAPLTSEMSEHREQTALDPWPFVSIRYRRFASLTSEQQQDVEDLLEHQIAKFEAKNVPPHKAKGAHACGKEAQARPGKSPRAA